MAIENLTLPKTQRAVIVNDKDQVTIWDEAPCPIMSPDQIYVRTEAVAINPSDTKMRGSFVTSMGILGTDYAGTVVAVGSRVRGVDVGDRVCGAQNAMHASAPDRGAFGQWNASNGDVWLKLPPSWSTEAGATLGAGVSTAGIAIKLLGLPLPSSPVDKPAKVLVYGGSTATATIAIQLLRLANLIPIATCSPKNFELVKSHGAEEVFDYHDKDCVDKILDSTQGNLKYALDCITTVESTAFCFKAIGRAGGKYVSLDPIPAHAATRKVVKTDWVLGPSIFGEGSTWPEPYGRPPSDEMRRYGAELFALAQKLVCEGKLKHHPLRILDGGLEAVLGGMDVIKSGAHSGEKLVVRMI
ncbi:Enoyl reductase LovC 1 [Colletotrichum truncatum]|uniref:Enoyl reductase LovC 1 n=1 Tax=Colletotrichum truncatum TaxID=5467 RepID=A0ACC3ZBD4_COLTU|nr:Enoyl reductase LovC 1 [Colletotrichum truncatum]KAF6787748.1 Enoyl reductase LovC 1 [Colletotrichum truncatum]